MLSRLSVALACGVSLAGAEDVLFSISAHADSEPFDNSIQTKCVGSSHAATGLRADWQQQLAKVRNEIGPEYIRFHGLFDDDMSVVKNGNINMADTRAELAPTCTFVKGRDFQDPGGPAFASTTKEECCAICYNKPTGLPQPCIAATWTPSQGGMCYMKLSTNAPVSAAHPGTYSCTTSRPSPKGYVYSWVNIFSLFDYLLSIGMRPIVELSFMPSLLASDPGSTVFWYKGGISPPKNWGDWRDFISAFVKALIERYGQDEIRQWYFEVWNEPNCGFYKVGHCCGPSCGDKDSYFDLFTNTYQAIKDVDTGMRVGGPATAQLSWLGDFMRNATLAGFRPDFVSSHLYPTDPFIDPGRDGFAAAVANAAEEVRQAVADSTNGPFDVPPLLLTEFNCGLGIKCADAPYAGSFLAHNALMSQRTKQSVPLESYWTFSDIFEEQGQEGSEFSQAFGMQSIHGVPKPVYRVLQLIRRLHKTSFSVKRSTNSIGSPIDVMYTKEDNHVEIMVANHPNVTANISAINLAQIAGQQVPGTKTVVLSIESDGGFIPDVVELRRVGSTHANALALFSKLGSPEYPDAGMLAALQKASEVIVEKYPTKPTATGFDICLDMEMYSVASISFDMTAEVRLVV